MVSAVLQFFTMFRLHMLSTLVPMGSCASISSGVTISSCSADDYSVQRFCPCAMNRITIAESSNTIPVSSVFPPSTIFRTPTQILGQQSTDSKLVLYYSFAPETVTGNIVSNMAAVQFSGITGILQMGPAVINNQLILSSAQKQCLVTATPFSTVSSGLSIACWFRSPSISQVWARIFDFGNGPRSDNIILSPTGYSNQITFLLFIGTTWIEYKLPGSYNDYVWRHVGWIFNPRRHLEHLHEWHVNPAVAR